MSPTSLSPVAPLVHTAVPILPVALVKTQIKLSFQMSCISSAAVDRLKVTHLVDTSIQANAVGVGQLKVSAVSKVITGHCQ